MPTHPRRSRCRDPETEEASRPALPRRREHAGRDRAPRAAAAERRRARDRARNGDPDRLPRDTSPPSSRRRARPLARRAASRDPGRSRQRQRRVRRCGEVRVRIARTPAREARREPAVQRRDADRAREPRRHPFARAVGRDGAARGRGQVLRGAPDEGIRLGFSPAPAERAARRLPSSSADRVSPETARGVGDRRFRAHCRCAVVSSSCVPSSRRRSLIEGRRSPTPSLSQDLRRAPTPSVRSRPSDGRSTAVRKSSCRTSSSRWRGCSRELWPRRARRSTWDSSWDRFGRDGKHEVATALVRVDLYDTVEVETTRSDEIVVDGFEDTIVRRALEELTRRAGESARVAGNDREAHPGRRWPRRR